MNAFVEMVNGIAGQWSQGMGLVVWQSAALAAVVYLVTLCIRRISAAACFWLWMLVPLRLLVMPLITISLPLLPAPSFPPENVIVEPAALEQLPAGPVRAIDTTAAQGATEEAVDITRAHQRRCVTKPILGEVPNMVWDRQSALLISTTTVSMISLLVRVMQQNMPAAFTYIGEKSTLRAIVQT